MPEEITIRDELTKMLDADPFMPFRIVMASGDRYEITDRHRVAVGENVILVVPPKSTHSMLRPNQVSSIDVLDPDTKSV